MTPPRLLMARFEAPPPIGSVLIVSDTRSLVVLDFGGPEDRLRRFLRARFGPDVSHVDTDDPQGFGSAVAAYFAGTVDALDHIPVDGGGSPFQRLVWGALRRIPAGQTRSYGQIASSIGQPGAARAVGLANGQNPVNLAVPCHRVIGSDGSMTGYGGGLDRKRWLLAHERAIAVQADLPFQPDEPAIAGG